MANKEERIAGIIRKSISEIITMELKNPHLGFVTIPEVKVSKDFSYAKCMSPSCLKTKSKKA